MTPERARKLMAELLEIREETNLVRRESLYAAFGRKLSTLRADGELSRQPGEEG